jgi:hypothetical protein
LVSSLQYLDALQCITSQAAFGTGKDGEPISFSDVVDARWASSRDSQDTFGKAWVLAEAYLPDTVADLLGRIWDQRSEIWANQSTHFAVVKQTPQDQQFRRKGFGSEPAAVLTKLRNEAKARLRPIIHTRKPSLRNREVKPLASLPALSS